jgi:hypothetical protein
MPEQPIIPSLQAASGRTFTVRLNDASSAGFSINSQHPDAEQVEELATDLLVVHGGDKLFRGRFGPSTDSGDGTSAHADFTAWDYREVLNRRILLPGDTTSFTGVEQTTIAWTIANVSQTRAGGDLGVTAAESVGSTGVVRNLTLGTGMKCGEQVQLLSEAVNGFEWDISPDLQFVPYYPVRGNQDSTFLLDYGGSVSGYTRTVDPGAFANVLRLSGNGSGVFTADDIANSAAGRWETNVGNLDLSQNAIDARGPYMLAQQGLLPSYSLKLDPAKWPGPDELWIGDKPRLVIRSGRLDVDTTDLRVTEMRFDIGDDETEAITVQLGYRPANQYVRLRSASQRLDRLERR